MMASCSVCATPVEAALGFTHKCGHSTHAVCIPDENNVDFKKCARCNGSIAASTTAAASIQEPRPTDGIDYVKNPGKRSTAASLVGKVASLVSRAPPEDLKTTQNAHTLLNHRVPIPEIMRRNHLGLWHMLRDGVTIDDFARNNYTWQDLMYFEDIGQAVPRRVAETLISGLRITANHMRDYPRLLPADELQKRADIGPPKICTHLGLGFPVATSLQCQGDVNWSAKDSVQLGYSLEDLMDIGLVYTQQYEDLLYGLSTPQIAEAERALGVTPEKLAALVDYNEMIAQQQEEERRRVEEYQRQMIRAPPQPHPLAVEAVQEAPPLDLTPVRRKTPSGPPPKNYIQRSRERFARTGFVVK